MKKNRLLSPLCLAAAAALVLSGCGQSVADARTDAYSRISQMQGLSASQVQEYQAQLNSAADAAAIKHILESAQSVNDRQLAEEASADATASARAATISQLTTALSGATLVGTSPECLDMTITFNADGTWEGAAGESASCLGFISRPINENSYKERADVWEITAENGGTLMATSTNGWQLFAYYAVTVNGNSYRFEAVKRPQGDIVGVEGSHTFVLSSSSS